MITRALDPRQKATSLSGVVPGQESTSLAARQEPCLGAPGAEGAGRQCAMRRWWAQYGWPACGSAPQKWKPAATGSPIGQRQVSRLSSSSAHGGLADGSVSGGAVSRRACSRRACRRASARALAPRLLGARQLALRRGRARHRADRTVVARSGGAAAVETEPARLAEDRRARQAADLARDLRQRAPDGPEVPQPRDRRVGPAERCRFFDCLRGAMRCVALRQGDQLHAPSPCWFHVSHPPRAARGRGAIASASPRPR